MIELTNDVIEYIVQQFNLRYEELSADPYEDTEGGMSVREKRERSCIAVRAGVRHYARTGVKRHWRDAQEADAHDDASRAEPALAVDPSWSTPRQ